MVSDNLTKLLCMLVSQSFVVAMQPDPVLKTQHKFVAEVRLLIGDKLGIKQHLVNTNVSVKIIAEEEARMLSTAQLSEKDMYVQLMDSFCWLSAIQAKWERRRVKYVLLRKYKKSPYALSG